MGITWFQEYIHLFFLVRATWSGALPSMALKGGCVFFFLLTEGHRYETILDMPKS
jgi:hypothetical protein